jgi:hypothetical protein
MSNQSAAAAVLKGTDPRPKPPLNTSWTVSDPPLTGWSALELTTDISGLLSGTVTINSVSLSIQGYISKNNKIKFTFEDCSGNVYVAKGTYSFNSSTNTASISGNLYLKDSDSTASRPQNRDTDEGTWTATAQTGVTPGTGTTYT